MVTSVDLGYSLLLGPVKDENEARQFIKLHQTFTGEGHICERLFFKRRDLTLENFFVVKDTATGEVVSTTCLLPWVVNVDGVALSAAMLEMVITHPQYRHHGLIRAQIGYFQDVVRGAGYDFSIIGGIPFFYRQFGYGYALEQGRSVSLSTRLIPNSDQAGLYQFRPPQPEDFPKLTSLHRAMMVNQQISVQRSQEIWEFMVQAMGLPFYVIEAGPEKTWLGYFCGQVKDGVLSLQENGLVDQAHIPAFLAKLKSDFPGEIEVVGNPADPLYRAVEALGGKESFPYQWLVNIPDPSRLLSRLGPVFERRLKEAGLGHLSTRLLINFYREAVCITITAGQISGVERRGFVDTSMSAVEKSDLCIPPDAFARLVFGHRSIGELRDAWPDLSALPQSRRVLDCLFPSMNSWLIMPF